MRPLRVFWVTLKSTNSCHCCIHFQAIWIHCVLTLDDDLHISALSPSHLGGQGQHSVMPSHPLPAPSFPSPHPSPRMEKAESRKAWTQVLWLLKKALAPAQEGCSYACERQGKRSNVQPVLVQAKQTVKMKSFLSYSAKTEPGVHKGNA